MRRSIFAIAVFTSFALLACEDGPNDPYAPAPAGAGVLINSGNPDASVDPSTGPLDASFPTKNLLIICDSDTQRSTWAKMLTAPIIPPRKYAQIDMAADDTWRGISVEEAEKINCQGTNLGFAPCDDPNGCIDLGWGNNQEVIFSYDPTTHLVYQMSLQLGYIGHMRFFSADNKSCYDMSIGQGPILKGVYDASQMWDPQNQDDSVWAKACTMEKPFLIDWLKPNGPTETTELFNAAMNTYLPGYAPPSMNCQADHGCLYLPDDSTGHAIFGIRPMRFYWVSTQYQPQPIPSTGFYVYNFYTKSQPFSNLPMNLELSNTGPVATGLVGNATTNTCTVDTDCPTTMPYGCNNPMGTANGGKCYHACNVQIGQKYSDLLQNCVNVTGSMKYDAVNVAKLTGGSTHDFEHINFNVAGVLGNFTDIDLQPFDVVQDYTKVAATWPEEDWYFDVFATGTALNEGANGCPGDCHGSGLLVREWQRLMLKDLNTLLGKTGPAAFVPGDSRCVNVGLAAAQAAGCTGIESLLLPGAPRPDDTPGQVLMADPGFYQLSFMQPGDPKSAFCDYVAPVDPSYSTCVLAPVWDNALNRVIQVLGKGNINSLIPELRDRRYYFKWFGYALIKYLKANGTVGDAALQGAGGQTSVATQVYDPFSIFFDNEFGAQFDTVEYIDRDFMSTVPVPWDFGYGTDVRVANQRYTQWFRRMDREEKAMYSAMLVTKTDAPGFENNVMLTNLFGSPVLTSAWNTYTCSTQGSDPNDPNGCVNPNTGAPNPAPVPQATPDTGTPYVLTQFYPGAWGKTVFSKGRSAIQIEQETLGIGAAKTKIPNFQNPYAAVTRDDPTFGAGVYKGTVSPAGDIEVLVPWYPQIPGNGFQVPLNGNQFKTVTTAALDFTGVLETYLVDFEYFTDPVKTNCNTDADCNTAGGFHCDTTPNHFITTPQGAGECTDNTIKVDAVECHDFLGEVFLCQDPATGDILHTGMYGSVLTLLDWVAKHPGAQDACGLLVGYSPYNNYPAFMASTNNGVLVSINAGAGFGRVVDATLYDPVFQSN